MYTEFKGQNISNDNHDNNDNQTSDNSKNIVEKKSEETNATMQTTKKVEPKLAIESNLYKDPDKDERTIGNKFLSGVSKILLVIIVIITVFLSLIQFGVISLASKILPNAIILNQTEIGIKKGKRYQLVSDVFPANAESKQIVYESSDPSVATVNEVTGYIKALKNGTAIITARTVINDKKVECVVNVGDTNISASNLSLKEKQINLAAGYTSTLSYNISPKNATDIELNFTSSDSSIANVNKNGVITALKEGTAIITAATNNNMLVDQAYVTVYKTGTNTVVNGDIVETQSYPKSINIPSDKSVSIGAELQLEADIEPKNAISELSYISSNQNVATVTNDGVVRALGVGDTDIIAKTVNGNTSVCHLSVGNYSVKLSKIRITTRYSFLQLGQKKKLYVSYEPTNASNPTIKWVSSNPSVVTVDNAGNIKAMGVGNAQITAESVEGTILTDVIDIEVGGGSSVVDLKGLSVDRSTRDVYVGSTEQITPVFDPANATYKAVTYISSNPSVATVDSSGNVLGIREGQTTVNIKSNRSTASADVVINVKNNPATSVELNSTDVKLKVSETFTLNSTVKPSNASIKTVTYMSSNPSIATVDQLGIIRGLSSGTTTITVTPNGGGSPSTCLVTVN